MEKGHFVKIRLDGIGTIWVAGTRRGIYRIELRGNKKKFPTSLPADIAWEENKKPFKALISKLKRFVLGKKVKFNMRLDLRGTRFQRQVWKKIATIPREETKSYAWLARAVGRPKAYRAVANACGANPAPIIIPCHRVIASDGTLGGFSAGIALKKKMLLAEGIFAE